MPIPCVPGLLWQGNWIPPMRSYGGANPSLTDIILEAGSYIFPSHFVSQFDLVLGQGIEGASAADIAIVSRDLLAWYLLFVEPSIESDEESLIERLELARAHVFAAREANELSTKMKEVNLEQAISVVQNAPEFVVVTDDPHHGLYKKFSSTELEVKVMVVEPFMYEEGYFIRINGDNPTEVGMGVIAHCDYHEIIPNLLLVTWTNLNEILRPGTIALRYGDTETQWTLVQAGQKWQLQPAEFFPLLGPPPFEIVLDEDRTLTIRNSAH